MNGESDFQRRPRGNLGRLPSFIGHVFLRVARFVKRRREFARAEKMRLPVGAIVTEIQ
jgi:hypothetical protein